MKPFLLTVALLGAIAAAAQKDTARMQLLPVPSKADFSISPDFPTLRMSLFDSRWYNMLGGNVPLVSYKTPWGDACAATSGYIELHDVVQQQFMSWQLWRGNFGLDVYFLPTLKAPVIAFGWASVPTTKASMLLILNPFRHIVLNNPILCLIMVRRVRLNIMVWRRVMNILPLMRD